MPLVSHQAFGTQPVQYSVTYLPDDPDGQVAGTIERMRQYAREDAGSPEVAGEVSNAIQQYPGVPTYESIFRYVKSKTTFKNDIDIINPVVASLGLGDVDVVETLIRPRDMAVMSSRMGDCDDYSMLGASMLMSAGYQPSDIKFVTVAADPSAPDNFSHVYLALVQDGVRIPLDLSHGGYPGWETPRTYRRSEWSLSHPLEMAGLIVVALYTAWKLARRY